jgi:hypothetical protein
MGETMRGRNEIKLNPRTMMDIVQAWACQHFEGQVVESVHEEKEGYFKVVVLSDTKNPMEKQEVKR